MVERQLIQMRQTGLHKALSSESRMKILSLLYRGPMSIDDISEKTDLQPITLRHHLSLLAEAGLVSSFEKRTGRVGRPRKFYRIADDSPVITYPKRNYQDLSEVLIRTLVEELGEEEARTVLEERAGQMGRRTAKLLSQSNSLGDWTLRDFADLYVKEFLASAGYEPTIVEVEDNRLVYRVNNCLFYELASDMPEYLCDSMDSAAHKEMCSVMNSDWKIERAKCIARGSEYCEYVLRA
jgi:predicted ArsR family transcriptional regulator